MSGHRSLDFVKFKLLNSKVLLAVDKSGDCTFMTSWIQCMLQNVPDLSKVTHRYYDVVQVNILAAIYTNKA